MLDLTTVRSKCQEVLHAHGWTVIEHSYSIAFAKKEFVTAVGIKVAHATMHDHDGYNFSIRGEYRSEGNNVLSCGTLVPVEVDVDEVGKLATEFCQHAEKRIDDSYARRLYLKFGVE